MDSAKIPPFKVLIAGGSIAGLTLANALARANVDFLVFESHSRIDASIGGALTIVSNGQRILDQMGIYDEIHPYLEPTGDVYTYLKDGRLLGKMDTPKVMRERYLFDHTPFATIWTGANSIVGIIILSLGYRESNC